VTSEKNRLPRAEPVESARLAAPAHSDLLLRSRWLAPVAVLIVLFHFSPIAETLNHAFFDAVSRHPFRSPPLPANSALVLIDEQTLTEMSKLGLRWPFRRETFAQLIAALHLAGAQKIVMDFTFFEESAGWEDQVLANVAAVAPEVVLARTEEKEPVFWTADFRAAQPQYFRQARAGLVELPADADGVSRDYPVPGSLAGVAAGTGPSVSGGLLRWHGGLEDLGPRGVPVLSAISFIREGQPVVRRLVERSPNLEPAEFADALGTEAPLVQPPFDQVRGRVVFVGSNASGTYDMKPLPVGKIEPGILLHWTAWTNLVAGGFIEALSWPWIFGVGLLVGNGVLFAGVNRLSAVAPVLAALFAIALLLLATWIAPSFGWFLPPATPIVAVVLVLVGVVVENFWQEQRRKREIQGMFGAYVDPGVVERLVRNPDSIALRGERREATVFFSDLAGFTDLSEKLKHEPERMVEIVNAYLEQTSECLHRHGAYVDKYIGDAVMAVLGAPQELPNHALAACRAALEARKAIDDINARYAGPVGVELEVRIGLNTGELIVGNLGSSRKKNYTVMGDTVNLASRLEGANKYFGTGILMGDETARRVQGHLLTRPLARLRVKGKLEAIEVHTLHGAPENLSAAEKEFVAAYRTGYAAYVERRFAEAAAALSQALTLQPDDDTTRRLHTEATSFVQSPPPATWEPVISLDSK